MGPPLRVSFFVVAAGDGVALYNAKTHRFLQITDPRMGLGFRVRSQLQAGVLEEKGLRYGSCIAVSIVQGTVENGPQIRTPKTIDFLYLKDLRVDLRSSKRKDSTPLPETLHPKPEALNPDSLLNPAP